MTSTREASNSSQRGQLKLNNISKKFSNSEIPALDKINLFCREGEFVVLVGPSGCGKSTLLHIAAGMLESDTGEVYLDDKRMDGPGPERAMVFQDHGLFPWLNAAENVEFGLKMRGMSRLERWEHVDRAFKMVNLVTSKKKWIHELSGGMRQRIAIARAMVVNPAVLLMDEPFASLDAQTRTLMHIQLQELWQSTRKTIIFVTHSVGEAVCLASRIIILNASPGRIRKEIPVDLSYPRTIDSAAMNDLVRLVRSEIEKEVTRINLIGSVA